MKGVTESQVIWYCYLSNNFALDWDFDIHLRRFRFAILPTVPAFYKKKKKKLFSPYSFLGEII